MGELRSCQSVHGSASAATRLTDVLCPVDFAAASNTANSAIGISARGMHRASRVSARPLSRPSQPHPFGKGLFRGSLKETETSITGKLARGTFAAKLLPCMSRGVGDGWGAAARPVGLLFPLFDNLPVHYRWLSIAKSRNRIPDLSIRSANTSGWNRVIANQHFHNDPRNILRDRKTNLSR